jgi:hypothetical protein
LKLGFLIIAHDQPGNVARLARRLLESDSYVSIHYDLKGGQRPVAEIRDQLGELASKVVWAERVSVGWGEWSIVQATLNAVRAMFDSGAEPDYIHLMSGADYPIRPIDDFRGFLERHSGTDFLESRSMDGRSWVKGGLHKERFHYRHFFNNRQHPRLFTLNWKLQRALKLKRKTPENLQMHMGSQWCTLTGQSWRNILARADKRVLEFFRHSWIPDEMFAQTLLAGQGTPHSSRHLTLYQFSDYGVPIVFYDGHLEYLLRQPFFFARKMSPHAARLRDGLDDVIAGRVSARRFKDHEIGYPTAEYETFRTLYREGLNGIRTPGYFRNAWSGDLEWNRRPYIGIFGASSEELEQVAKAVDAIPGMVCHRFLFAKKSIGFAKGQERFAGYSKEDTALRDNKPTNFLVDVIGASPGMTTCFLVNTSEPSEIFEYMRWDANAHIIHVDGGWIGSFLERHAEFDIERESGERIDGLGRTAVQHLTNHIEAHKKLIEQRRKWLLEGRAKFAWLDMLRSNWRKSLASVLSGLGHEFTDLGRVLTGTPGSQRRRRLDVSAELLGKIVSAAQSKADKEHVLREIMAQPKQPYLIILGASRREAARLGNALDANHLFTDETAGNVSFASSLLKLVDAHVSNQDRPGLLSLGLEDFMGIDLFLNDPDARFVFLSAPAEEVAVGKLAADFVNAGGASPENAMWCNPVEFRKTLADTAGAMAGVRARLSHATCPVIEIDLSQPDWDRELALFLQGTFLSLAQRGSEVRQVLAGRRKDTLKSPQPDPFAIFQNREYLRLLSRKHANLLPAEPELEAHFESVEFATSDKDE